jgi:fructokinase
MIDQARILCFGEALWDLPPGGKVAGGAPLNVAMRLIAEGADARLLTRVGEDDLGRELMAHMRAGGLDLDGVQSDPVNPTGRVNVDVSDPLHARYDIEFPAAWDFIDAGPPDNGWDCDVLVFGSLATRHPVSQQSLECLLAQVDLRVFDVNLRPPFVDQARIESLLQAADWAKLNDDELQQISGWSGASGDLEQQARQLAERYELDTLCITLGGSGAFMLHRGESFRHAGFSVQVSDTVGCGDAFLAAWLVGMLSGRQPNAALTRASAVGALVAEHTGANPAITEDQVQQLIQGDPRTTD